MPLFIPEAWMSFIPQFENEEKRRWNGGKSLINTLRCGSETPTSTIAMGTAAGSAAASGNGSAEGAADAVAARSRSRGGSVVAKNFIFESFQISLGRLCYAKSILVFPNLDTKWCSNYNIIYRYLI